jgi:hypothetical protein
VDDFDYMPALRRLYSDIGFFSKRLWPDLALRSYQLPPARALVEAINRNLSGSPGGPNQFAVVFSRQAGKDEMTAQLLAYLLNLYQRRGGQIVVAAPTVRQASISRDRLAQRLDNPLNKALAGGRENYIVTLGRANARFLSAAPTSNARGETASILLVANESQDIEPDRWDAVFDPMAASTNATTLFLGTVWTSTTLLARQMRHLRALEQTDGLQRVFLIDWRSVAAVVPAYGQRVRDRIAQFGENHPFIQTEYFLKELEGEGGLFGAARRALMVGTHERQEAASAGKTYALLVDVAGEDEAGIEGFELRSMAPRKDSTAVTVVEVTPGDALQPQPTYRVVNRYVWTGVKHSSIHGRLVGLARDTWKARYIVVDATGIGAPVASFLTAALGEKRVLPFQFNSSTKSELGWGFTGIIDSGRYKEYASDGAFDSTWFWRQLEAVEYEVRPGPGQLLKWAVPDPAMHDDLVMSAALVAVLEEQDWRPRIAYGVANRL